MGFYSLSKEERAQLVRGIQADVLSGLRKNEVNAFIHHFSDDDTYIRKAAYLSVGKIYNIEALSSQKIISALNLLFNSSLEKVRQTSINAAGEIGKTDFEKVQYFFDKGLFDEHHIVRNAVIGSIKKMGEKNPDPVLKWAKRYLHHPNKEIRREICHGIELRGRKHPEDVLPLLKELQHDSTARVKNTLIHVLGQISYKKGCLNTVVKALNTWKNKELVNKALDEIVDVHSRYKDFAVLTQEQALEFIRLNYQDE